MLTHVIIMNSNEPLSCWGSSVANLKCRISLIRWKRASLAYGESVACLNPSLARHLDDHVSNILRFLKRYASTI